MLEKMSIKKIPIVFSSSDYYVPYLAVAIKSLVENASKKTQYEIFVFHNNISQYNEKRIRRLVDKANIEVSFCKFGEEIGGVSEETFFVPGEFVSKETYYRLFAPSVLSKYKKIVYLDCDVVVKRDVAELYEIELDGYALGATWNYSDYGTISHIKKNMKIPIERCINCGVLLIDTERFLEEDILKKCLDVMEDYIEPQWADQEIINIAAWKQFKLIDPRWNFQLHALLNERSKKPEELERVLELVKDDQFIIHFSGDEKPWEKPDMKYAYLFWSYARKTEFYEEILFREFNSKKGNTDIFGKYIFPFDRVKKDDRVILYGMGHVGDIFYKQNDVRGFCNIVTCVDKDYKSFNSEMKVQAPDIIMSVDYDYVIICAEYSPIRDEIYKEILDMGISESKIIAESPLKKWDSL